MMFFYLIEFLPNSTSVQLQFPVNPEEIAVQADGQSQTFTVLELGEISLPRGRKATRYSWSGFFPGAGRAGQPFMTFWRPPLDLVWQLETWHGQNSRLRLIVSDTDINKDVYVDSFKRTHGKGSAYGDVEYSIELVEYRQLIIRADGEDQAQGITLEALSRPDAPTPSTYTVREGDSLWLIAQRLWDDGSRWGEVYEANADEIGPDPNTIQVGMELQIPGGISPSASTQGGGGSAYVIPVAPGNEWQRYAI
jgi:hypothetical protein